MVKSVLILGGSGQAGSGAAALLRRWYPDLPLTIAGRDLDRAQRVADELGAATAVTVDLQRPDFGLQTDHSAVIAALWDSQLHGLRYAQERGLPYLSISSGLIEIAPEVVATAQRPSAAPVLVASHFCAGVLIPAVMELVRDFGPVDTVRIGAVLDESDIGGPAGLADLERWSVAAPAGLVRRDGIFEWVRDQQVGVSTLDGTVVPGERIGILDVPSLALATGAANVSFDFAVGKSAGRRRGAGPSLEVRIDLERAGESTGKTQYLVHPEGQRPLTALGIALGVERLLGLRGEPVAPGIHTPEGILEPAYVVERLIEVGAAFVDGPST
ncbi:saccharopine dehydrogenase [Kribbella sp. NPDC050470]|uniref:saccharopine dehydrogenase n=1 Tax=unclassified Kribbella TaxID=2644121 RepID=UPI0037A16F19